MLTEFGDGSSHKLIIGFVIGGRALRPVVIVVFKDEINRAVILVVEKGTL